MGLILDPRPDGTYIVAGIATLGGRPVTQAVCSGDKLVKVDALAVQGAAVHNVVDALRGKPGESRTLLIERGAQLLTIKLPVRRVL